MGRRLIHALCEIIPTVIDFEYTTPTDAAPESIKVAVQALWVHQDRLKRTARCEALLRPPDHAQLATFDTAQTGITPAMLASQSSAGDVLAALDRRFTAGPTCWSPTTPGRGPDLSAYRENRPTLARIDLIDTVRLVRNLYPELPKHGLDELRWHLTIPSPPQPPPCHGRRPAHHRAVHPHGHRQRLGHLRQLRRLAGYAAEAAQPEQITLFG